jgi:hypothetical protein
MTLARLTLRDQPRLNTDLGRNPAFAQPTGNGIPTRRCKSDSEGLGGFAVKASRNEIGARCASIILTQRFAIEFLGDRVRFEDARSEPGVVAITFFGDLDSEFPGERPRGFGKGETLMGHHEANDVATGLATEAMKDFAIWIDVERRRLLVVERTEALPVPARLPEFDITRHEGDDIRSASDLLDRGFRDPAQSASFPAFSAYPRRLDSAPRPLADG